VVVWGGESCTLSYSFRTDCPRDSLVDAFLRPQHVQACVRRANLTIVVHDTAAFQNHIEYIYNYMVSKLWIRFGRVADTAAGRVSFAMESCSTSGSGVIPSVRSTEGYYQFSAAGDSMQVDYWQQITLDRSLNSFYVYFIRRDARRVVHNQQRYVNERHRWQQPTP
jgi:hypothetical protein